MIYTAKDSSDGCFSNGLGTLHAGMPAVRGIQDGVHIHRPSKLAFVCSGNGVWVYAIDEQSPLGMIHMQGGVTQVTFDEEAIGIATVYLFAETELWTVNINFGAFMRNHTPPAPVDSRLSAPTRSSDTDDTDYGAVFAVGFAGGAAAFLLCVVSALLYKSKRLQKNDCLSRRSS